MRPDRREGLDGPFAVVGRALRLLGCRLGVVDHRAADGGGSGGRLLGHGPRVGRRLRGAGDGWRRSFRDQQRDGCGRRGERRQAQHQLAASLRPAGGHRRSLTAVRDTGKPGSVRFGCGRLGLGRLGREAGGARVDVTLRDITDQPVVRGDG